ncbi:hypothetical protein RJT34_14336 [Clitoria ternatea]|uniref:Hydrophobic seed protein domain-containing protein n=1 Tax=Clitoria ternatea TaxID=43366 RepID=A0AAN9JQ84_CLITE
MGFKGVASIGFFLLNINLFLFCMHVSSATPSPVSPPPPKCPELGICLGVLGIELEPGPQPNNSHCCPLLGGLADAEVSVCICDMLRSRILGLPVNLDIAVKRILSFCGHNINNYTCD